MYQKENEEVKLTIYPIDAKEPAYVISNPQNDNSSSYFLFFPRQRIIQPIDNPLEFMKRNPHLKKGTISSEDKDILIEVLTSLKNVAKSIEEVKTKKSNKS